MIFDRTQNDVDTARFLIETKVKFDPITMQPINSEELTESEIAILEKGTMTKNTLNRIEGKQNELKIALQNFSYKFEFDSKTNWSEKDIPTNDDYIRILKNLQILKDNYYVLTSSPTVPTSMMDFESLNKIEKLLVDIEKIIQNMIDSFKYVGNDYYMGGYF